MVSARERCAARARAALALGVLLAAGCERDVPPAATPPPQAAPPAAEAPAGGAPPEPSGAAEAAPVPPFDVGEVKGAAEYLLEPELAGADMKRGQLLSLACAACHSLGAGEKTIVGPNLHDVFGRRAGAVEGFGYSLALRSSGLVWTPRALDAWLADPASFVVGTKMTFTGYRSAEDRRDLIAYLLRATQ
jgi:cytochrome c